jgi:2-keto-4-pentenoate hydratase/2-oxohepta-3-ene-1,7-dioic acid hydratase in catechol pathway
MKKDLKIVRFASKGKIKYGVWEGDTIQGYLRDPFCSSEKFSPDNTTYKISEVKLLAPCEPSKIVCLGLNYRSHIQETGFQEPDEPLMFLKPSTSVIGPEDYVVLPTFAVKSRIDYEGEVGVVIGKEAKDVAEKDALEYVLGYTCVNDVSARYYQKKDVQWTRAKGFDTFCPIGPCIANLTNPERIELQTIVNGQTRQSSDTSYLIFSIRKLVSFISGVMTLLPGDVISTGTPEGIGPMQAGDIVEIKVGGVGTLKNYVKNKAEPTN